MKDQVLWRKNARIIMMLANRLAADPTDAMDIFYNSHTYSLLTNPDSGLQLQSDEFILNDILAEIGAS